MSLRLVVALTALSLLLPTAVGSESHARGSRFDCSALYDSGDYPAAVECFESLETTGIHNGHLLYNLGNAWYRSGDPARALLAYRRAALYLPRDGDLKANLGSARDQTQDDLAAPDIREPLLETLLAPYDALSKRELLLLGLASWVLLFVLLGIRNYRTVPFGRLSAVALASLALFGLLGAGVRSYQTEHHPIAIVVVDEATVRSGRDLHSTDLVRLHAGAELKVLQRGERWMQVALSTGTRGWLPAEALGLVQPLPPAPPLL